MFSLMSSIYQQVQHHFFPLVSLYGNKQTVATDKKGEKLFY